MYARWTTVTSMTVGVGKAIIYIRGKLYFTGIFCVLHPL